MKEAEDRSVREVFYCTVYLIAAYINKSLQLIIYFPETRLNIKLLCRYKSGQNHLTDFIGIEPSKKRKRRTSFTPQALELLNAHFERNTHPSGNKNQRLFFVISMISSDIFRKIYLFEKWNKNV